MFTNHTYFTQTLIKTFPPISLEHVRDNQVVEKQTMSQ